MLKTLKERIAHNINTYVIATVAKKLPAEQEASVYWFEGQTECTVTTLIDCVIPVSNQ